MPSVTDSEGQGRSPQGRERAALVGLITGAARRTHVEDALDELAGLADAADIVPVLRFTQDRDRPDPATLIGSGKLEILKAACEESDLSLVIFDSELTPAQLRNIEKILQLRVIDRTQLILDIFARRARTREGKLQVELAQLRYLLPRLVGASATRCRGSVAASAREGPAKPSSRPIVAASGCASARSPTTWPKCVVAAASCEIGVGGRNCRRWRWSATPTPARRRCSTG